MRNVAGSITAITALVFLLSAGISAAEVYECVIITHPDFVDECGELADWKNNTGISTRVVDTTWINNNFAGFDGTDLQAKIKDFIYESYYLSDTEYVILAGDVDKLPTRYAYVNDSYQDDGKYVPCDLYYADVIFLDEMGTLSDWDTNDDGYYGTMDVSGVVPTDTPDMKPDLAMGRLPASNGAELNTLIDKIVKYEISAYNSDWVKKATLVADNGCFNDSEDFKDQTAQYFMDWDVPSFNIQKLYGASCSADNIQNAINEGRGFVNYAGHGGLNGWTCPGYMNAHITSLTNGVKTPIIAAKACYTAGFDMPEGTGGIDPLPQPISDECVGEEFLLNKNGGGITYLGATRVSYHGMNKLSGLIDKKFWEAITRYDTPGEYWKYALKKEADRGDTGICSRKVLTEYVLLGDPTLRIDREVFFADDFENHGFSDEMWIPNNGEWHITENGDNYLWTTSPAPNGYDPVIQLQGTSTWTDYTVETDIAFIDAGTEEAVAYIIGRDTIQMGETHPYGGLYIASVDIYDYAGWIGYACVYRAYDANGNGTITPDELTLLDYEPLSLDMVSDLVNHYWCNLKVGFEGDTISVYVSSPSTDENLVLSVTDDVNKKGDIGLGACAAGTTITVAFDNVRVTKGCIFNDQFENSLFSSGAWIMSSSMDCYIDDIDGNGVLVIDDPAGTGPSAYVDQNFARKSVVLEGVFNISEDKPGYSQASVKIEQNNGESYSLLYGFNAKPDDETLSIYWYDTEIPEMETVSKSYPFTPNQWYNFKLVVDNDNNMMYAYVNNRLELELSLPGCTGNVSRVVLWDRYAKVLWDNIYVEQTPADTTPPTVSIASPGNGATISGIVTVEAIMSDTGGSGMLYTALYVNDTLVAVNTTSGDNPTFQLDTSLLDPGNCTLAVVAVDNDGNSNWTEVIIEVNNLPDLIITNITGEWIDLSWKTYNITYTVENVGDIATPHECWTNFTEVDGKWGDCDCVDPIPVPVLDVGESVTHAVGHFVCRGDSDCVEVCVDYNNTIVEKNES